MSNNIVSIPTPLPDLESLVASVQALREQVQVIVGDQGDVLDRAVTLRDLVNYSILDANLDEDYTINDITVDRSQANVVGYPDKTIVWVQEPVGSTWSPTTPQDIVVKFYSGGTQIASHTVRGQLNTGSGVITISSQATTGDDTTLNTVGSGTSTTPEVNVVHDNTTIAVPITFVSVQGGTNGSDGADGSDGLDGSDGVDGVIPPDANWGAGLTDIKITVNYTGEFTPNDGEIWLTAGTAKMYDGTERSMINDATVFTPYEGAVVPPTTGGTFYLMWGATNPGTRFGGGSWGNAQAETSGLFCAYYYAAQWTAVEDGGATYNFTPISTDYIIGVAFKVSVTGGIDSLSPLMPYSGDLGLLDSVPTGLIDPGVVDTLELAAEAVTNAKIAVDAIEAVNIKAGEVTEVKIANGAITADKILAGTISGDKIAANTITTNNLLARTILAGDIAVGTISAAEIAAATITGAKIAASTITASQIASGTITTNQIAANTIAADRLAVTTLSSITANVGLLNAGVIDANIITAGTLKADRLAISDVNFYVDGAGELVIGNADWQTQINGSGKPEDFATKNVAIQGYDRYRKTGTSQAITTGVYQPINNWARNFSDGTTIVTSLPGTGYAWTLAAGTFEITAVVEARKNTTTGTAGNNFYIVLQVLPFGSSTWATVAGTATSQFAGPAADMVIGENYPAVSLSTIGIVPAPVAGYQVRLAATSGGSSTTSNRFDLQIDTSMTFKRLNAV